MQSIAAWLAMLTSPPCNPTAPACAQVQQLGMPTNHVTAEEIHAHIAILEKGLQRQERPGADEEEEAEASQVLDTLRALSCYQVPWHLLEETQVCKVVLKLRNHTDPRISFLARNMVEVSSGAPSSPSPPRGGSA